MVTQIALGVAILLSVAAPTNGQLFRVTAAMMPYQQHVQHCLTLGGYRIATIRNEQENTDLLALLRESPNPNAPAYIGAIRQGNQWSWEDGYPWGRFIAENDGLQNPDETHLAFQVQRAEWHDWGNGAAWLRGVCRQEDTTTRAPSVTPPTPMPTQAPTQWFENAQNTAANVSALQGQVNALASSEVQISTQVASQNSDLNTLRDRVLALESQMAVMEQTRAAVLSAVSSFSSNLRQYDDTSASCIGDCNPSVEASGSSVSIKAPRGSVTIETGNPQCSAVDPCRNSIGLTAVELAFDELRNA